MVGVRQLIALSVPSSLDRNELARLRRRYSSNSCFAKSVPKVNKDISVTYRMRSPLRCPPAYEKCGHLSDSGHAERVGPKESRFCRCHPRQELHRRSRTRRALRIEKRAYDAIAAVRGDFGMSYGLVARPLWDISSQSFLGWVRAYRLRHQRVGPIRSAIRFRTCSTSGVLGEMAGSGAKMFSPRSQRFSAFSVSSTTQSAAFSSY